MALLYGDTGMDYFLKSFNMREARKRQNLTQNQVELFRARAKDSKIIPRVIVDSQILLFLNACDGDIDKAVKKFERYFECKRNSPEFFENRSYEAVKGTLDAGYYVGLPITPNNCNLISTRLKSYNPKDYIFDDGVKCFIMKSEIYTFKNGPRDGSIFLMDFIGFTFQYIFKPSLMSLIKGIRFGQEASPMVVKEIHILNTPYFVEYFMRIIRPFVWGEMLARVHFHPVDIDWDNFYEKFIPKSHLPSDYGGDLESLEVLHNRQCEEFLEMKEYFRLEQKHKNFEMDEFYDEFMEKRRVLQMHNELEEAQETEMMKRIN